MILLLLFLPCSTFAQLNVAVTVSDEEAHAAATCYGRQTNVVTDNEIKSFKLDGTKLKEAVKKYSGGYPTDAYLKKPAGPHRLYDTYGWDEVLRTLVAYRARVLKLKTVPTIVTKQKFTNHGNRNATYTATISQELSNTVETTWSNSQELSVTSQVTVGVDFKVASAEASLGYGFTYGWGKSETKSETVTVGSTSGVTLTLGPGEICEAQLHCTRGQQEVEVEYYAFLKGDVAVNYENTYKGHHFYAYSVYNILKTSDLPRNVDVTEILKIGYYSDADVIIKDIKSNDMLAEQQVPLGRSESEAERVARKLRNEQSGLG